MFVIFHFNEAMPGSKLDHVYRSILMTRFFTKGWGKPDNLKRLFAFRKIISKRETCFSLVEKDHPISIIKEEVHSDCKILEGQFTSPFVEHLPGLLPKESEIAYFQVILPKKWNSEHYKPVCLHLAGTGDHGFWRRRQTMAKPLLKNAGIAAVLLENPFYGLRKPKDQIRSCLHNVSDIFVMGGCLILESLALFHWCERHGLGPLGISGLSMGGHMASLAATSWPKPLVLVPCLSGSTASPVFTEGVMSYSINWELLESQYLSDEVYCEEIRKMFEIEEDAFRAGQHFAKNFPESMDHVNELKRLQKDNQQEQMSQQEQQVELQSQEEGAKPPEHELFEQEKLQGEKSQEYQHQNQREGQQKLQEQQQQQQGQKEQHQVQLLQDKQERQLGIKSTSNIPDKLDRNLKILNIISSQETAARDVNFISAGICPQTAAPADIEGATKEDKKNDKEEVPRIVNENEKSSQTKRSKLAAKFMTKFSLLKHFNKSKSKLLGSATKTDQSKQKTKQGSRSVTSRREREAFHFMRGIMDECTHLKNFDKPVDTELVISVCATDDAYVPSDAYIPLNELWPGADVRKVNAGHVAAYVLHHNTFRKTIVECFERMKKKYWNKNQH